MGTQVRGERAGGRSEVGEGFLPISALLVTETEKAMATHSSILAWKIPWTEEPGGLHSMGSLRVRHN